MTCQQTWPTILHSSNRSHLPKLICHQCTVVTVANCHSQEVAFRSRICKTRLVSVSVTVQRFLAQLWSVQRPTQSISFRFLACKYPILILIIFSYSYYLVHMDSTLVTLKRCPHCIKTYLFTHKYCDFKRNAVLKEFWEEIYQF